jgi:hypothetical protein
MSLQDITKKIVRMFELGELDPDIEYHKWNDYDIQVKEQNFRHHGLDGYIFQLSKNNNILVKIFYDSWSRLFYQDIINSNTI